MIRSRMENSYTQITNEMVFFLGKKTTVSRHLCFYFARSASGLGLSMQPSNEMSTQTHTFNMKTFSLSYFLKYVYRTVVLLNEHASISKATIQMKHAKNIYRHTRRKATSHLEKQKLQQQHRNIFQLNQLHAHSDFTAKAKRSGSNSHQPRE